MEIAFPIELNNGTIPMDNPVVFTRWMNLPEHKKISRDRGSADFWIFHHTTDFSRFHPVVIGRDVVDTYIMGATRYWNHSMIDCTFAGRVLRRGYQLILVAVSIHLGHTSSHSRQGSNYLDKRHNHITMDNSRIPGMKLSFPGDKLVCK